MKKRRESDLDFQIQSQFNLSQDFFGQRHPDNDENFFGDSFDDDTNLLNAMNKTKRYIEGLKSKYRFLSDPLV